MLHIYHHAQGSCRCTQEVEKAAGDKMWKGETYTSWKSNRYKMDGTNDERERERERGWK